jgi:hypothetical protein
MQPYHIYLLFFVIGDLVAFEAFAKSHELQVLSGPFRDGVECEEVCELIGEAITVSLWDVDALLTEELFESFTNALIKALEKVAGEVVKMLLELI